MSRSYKPEENQKLDGIIYLQLYNCTTSHPSLFSFWSPPTDIHALRPHPGQIEVAQRFRSLLDSDHHPSQIAGLMNIKKYSRKVLIIAFYICVPSSSRKPVCILEMLLPLALIKAVISELHQLKMRCMSCCGCICRQALAFLILCSLKYAAFNVCHMVLVCFYREPQVLWQSPGCLHHAVLSSGNPKFIYISQNHRFLPQLFKASATSGKRERENSHVLVSGSTT